MDLSRRRRTEEMSVGAKGPSEKLVGNHVDEMSVDVFDNIRSQVFCDPHDVTNHVRKLIGGKAPRPSDRFISSRTEIRSRRSCSTRSVAYSTRAPGARGCGGGTVSVSNEMICETVFGCP